MISLPGSVTRVERLQVDDEVGDDLEGAEDVAVPAEPFSRARSSRLVDQFRRHLGGEANIWVRRRWVQGLGLDHAWP
jgi:hypothetical protein